MRKVQMAIWKLWWECPHCLSVGEFEVDEGEEAPAETLVCCGICKRYYTGLWSPDLPLGLHEGLQPNNSLQPTLSTKRLNLHSYRHT